MNNYTLSRRIEYLMNPNIRAGIVNIFLLSPPSKKRSLNNYNILYAYSSSL